MCFCAAQQAVSLGLPSSLGFLILSLAICIYRHTHIHRKNTLGEYK